ncbi:MAG: hypothetical protein JJ971_00525 [Balneolaceae bacterium]|nr:hypothetical protein [Balneolaceae bacterium]MBO6544855.1 hypothetical protein [Balneolaceae bacterium]MBO6646251.1 hypothetical protein [Balneolaceae bacterium]
MTPEEYSFIKECLGIRRNTFYYYKDKYALEIIRMLCERNSEVKIGALKKSRFSFLLQKDPIKKVISKIGRDTLTLEDFDEVMDLNGKCFSFTISEWGEYKRHRNDSYFQTSRPGVNLVLQLNFDELHNRFYNQLINPEEGDHPFASTFHPVLVKREYTMSWARLDISLDTGEVLVEEIQNDWLRETRRMLELIEQWEESGRDYSDYWLMERTTLKKLRDYYTLFLKPYFKLWDEAMLCLVLQFCKEELGVERVWYHTFESGKHLKGYWEYSLPPRSLYTRLPKRFGFIETEEAPGFIRKEPYLKKKLRRKSLKWFTLLL